MLKTDIQTAFNQHINAGMYSSYIYLAMGAWFETQNLSGMAGGMKAQAREEWGVAEQVEEEATAKSIAERLRALGDSASSLLLMDRALGERK